MTKEYILAEIRRTAATNKGVALGRQRFLKETGIRQTDWIGKYWARWSDAIREAGLAPNALQEPFSDDLVITKLVELIRELGKFPVASELRLKATRDPSFPSHRVFDRFGLKRELAQRLQQYCRDREGFEDVLAMVTTHASAPSSNSDEPETAPAEPQVGEVYLLKVGRHYKLGRSNAFGRRERELAIQLPQKAVTVHVIRTDDPPGIEAYWHKRFAEKRGNGEWFELTKDDVSAFKRRQFM